MALYTRSGRRRLLPPIVFGLGVLAPSPPPRPTVRRRSHGVVPVLLAPRGGRGAQTAADSGSSSTGTRSGRELLARVPRPARRPGRLVGAAPVPSRAPARLLLLAAARAASARARAARRADAPRRAVRRSRRAARSAEPARPVVVFAGRLIPEKQVRSLVPALARAREQIPDLRGEIYGDGPEREEVLRAIAELGGSTGTSRRRGSSTRTSLERTLASALCLLLPSGGRATACVVVEAAARGVPTVVVEGPDNAATELVEEGVNGAVAARRRRTSSRPRSSASTRPAPELRALDARLVPTQRRAPVARAVAGDAARWRQEYGSARDPLARSASSYAERSSRSLGPREARDVRMARSAEPRLARRRPRAAVRSRSRSPSAARDRT